MAQRGTAGDGNGWETQPGGLPGDVALGVRSAGAPADALPLLPQPDPRACPAPPPACPVRPAARRATCRAPRRRQRGPPWAWCWAPPPSTQSRGGRPQTPARWPQPRAPASRSRCAGVCQSQAGLPLWARVPLGLECATCVLGAVHWAVVACGYLWLGAASHPSRPVNCFLCCAPLLAGCRTRSRLRATRCTWAAGRRGSSRSATASPPSQCRACLPAPACLPGCFCLPLPACLPACRPLPACVHLCVPHSLLSPRPWEADALLPGLPHLPPSMLPHSHLAPLPHRLPLPQGGLHPAQQDHAQPHLHPRPQLRAAQGGWSGGWVGGWVWTGAARGGGWAGSCAGLPCPAQRCRLAANRRAGGPAGAGKAPPLSTPHIRVPVPLHPHPPANIPCPCSPAAAGAGRPCGPEGLHRAARPPALRLLQQRWVAGGCALAAVGRATVPKICQNKACLHCSS